MVTVYIWNASGGWGHSSMSVGGSSGMYISWWPKYFQAPYRDGQPLRPESESVQAFRESVPSVSEPVAAGLYLGLRTARALNPDLLASAESHTMQEDQLLERGSPDQTIQISGLDESSITIWWRHWLSRSQFYCALNKNCSTTVAEALHHGDKKGYASAGGWHRWPPFWVWTPARVLAYAAAIRRGSMRRTVR